MSETEKYTFFENHFLEIINIIIVAGLILSMVLLQHSGIVEYSHIVTECEQSHIGNVEILNENNKKTWDQPRQICDVKSYRQSNGDFKVYDFSWDVQQKYNKNWWLVYPDCKGATLTEDMNFKCPDGSIAKEVRFNF